MDRYVRITSQVVETLDCVSRVLRPQAGGVDIFLGTVRDATQGKKVLRLEYEAYEPMALAEIGKIIDEACTKWTVLAVSVIHRVGHLLPGETAVALAVSTAHRHEAFDACRFIIDSMKATVPIWKKEIFEGGETWVSAHP